uniref:hypothetical protein n=1 Tax=Phocaeicola coprocola TaxID=310298 RepID=UPI0026DDC8AE
RVPAGTRLKGDTLKLETYEQIEVLTNSIRGWVQKYQFIRVVSNLGIYFARDVWYFLYFGAVSYC